MSDIMSIGVSALNAAQAGLLTTQNNIANASTAGYNRQQTIQAESLPEFTGSGFIGSGVDVTTVQRVFNQFLNTQIQQQQAQATQLSTYYTQIQQLNNALANQTSGLQTAIQGFFSAVNGVANAPSSQPARQAMLSSAQTLTQTFQSLNQLMVSMNSSVNGQIGSSVASINSYAQQIASLNQSIALATDNGNGQPPNALLDQRDQLVSQLNQQVQASVVKQSDGSYSIFIGNGQALVVGNQVLTLQTIPSQSDPSKLDVAYTNPNGSVTRLQTNSLQGGTLGGLYAFQNQTLTQAQDALGNVAIGLASTFNAQQSLGQDLNGAMGTNLFNTGTPQVTTNVSNTGTAALSATISNASALTGSDYTVAYNGTNYVITRLSDSTTTTSATLPLTIDGVTISLASGSPNAGDSFLIRPTVNGSSAIGVAISDPSKIAAAVPVVSSASLSNTGTGTISAARVNTPPPPNPNLQDNVAITFTGNPASAYNVVDTTTGTTLATGVAYTPGAPITYNGWTVQVSGTPNSNDAFSIGPNSNATTDGNNALLLAGLETQNTMLGGTASYEGAYGQLVSQVGTTTSQLQVTSQAQANLVNQTIQQQQSVSGVNLDEEAANLIQYQQAYQAASKSIQVANTMFDSILSILN